MPAPGLERCPRCDYDLQGLPQEHRCPECGLAYDTASRVWRPAPPLASHRRRPSHRSQP